MKKLLNVLVITGLLVSLVGCGSNEKPQEPAGPTAMEVYSATLKKQSEAIAMDANMNMDMKMSVADEVLTMNMAMDLQTTNSNSESIQMAMKSSITSPELAETGTPSMDMNIYYSDGYYYMDMMEMKLKYPLPLDEIQNQVNSSTEMFSYDENSITELNIKEVGDNYKLSFSLNEEEINSLIQQSLAQSGIGEVSFEIVTSEVSGTMLVTKEYELIEEKLIMVVDISVEDEVITMEMNLTMKINGLNDEVQVTLPNFDEYMEIDPAQLQ